MTKNSNAKKRKTMEVDGMDVPYIISTKKFNDIKAAEKFLGMPGRMLYSSKSMRKPTTIFNAGIFTEKLHNIWVGDIELDSDREKLLRLSTEIGTLYVASEIIVSIEKPRALKVLKEEVFATIKKDKIVYSERFNRYVNFWTERLRKGGKQ